MAAKIVLQGSFLQVGGSRPCRSPVKMGECSIDLTTTTIVNLVYASAGIIFQRNRALDYTLAILHITYMSTYYSTGRTAGRQRPVDRPHPGAIVPLPLSPTRILCAFTPAPVPPAPAPSLHAPPRPHPLTTGPRVL